MLAAERDEAVDIGGVRITHPDKVLYPEQGITKRALAEYYLAVADRMLPHLADRPATLVRCPTGRQKKCFYQRHVGSGVPDALGTVQITGFEDSGDYLYVRDRRGLLSLVQMGVLEVHPWGARVDNPQRPDRIVFDLDPGEGVAFAAVIQAAKEVRRVLSGLGLVAFAKTTGGKGLHVVVPIARRHPWGEAKSFARAVADMLSVQSPDRYLAKMSKAARRGRIFIDYLRNDPTSTAVAPYSTRARPGAPVACPVAWRELRDGFDPAALNLATVPARMRRSDPWADIGTINQRLPLQDPQLLSRAALTASKG